MRYWTPLIRQWLCGTVILVPAACLLLLWTDPGNELRRGTLAGLTASTLCLIPGILARCAPLEARTGRRYISRDTWLFYACVVGALLDSALTCVLSTWALLFAVEALAATGLALRIWRGCRPAAGYGAATVATLE
jgi:hypothetical protein